MMPAVMFVLLLLTVVAVFVGFAVQPASGQTFTLLHSFSGPDGSHPNAGVTPDAAGDLYGTTSSGGSSNQYCDSGCGTVFRLTRKSSGCGCYRPCTVSVEAVTVPTRRREWLSARMEAFLAQRRAFMVVTLVAFSALDHQRHSAAR